VSYDEFKPLYDKDIISVRVNKSAALRIVEYLPTRYRAAVYFWAFVWLLSIPACIAVAIFYKWWVGLILLCFIPPTFFTAIKKSCAEFVLGYAIEHGEFFDTLLSLDLLRLQRHDDI
jgi:hypothetical protein